MAKPIQKRTNARKPAPTAQDQSDQGTSPDDATAANGIEEAVDEPEPSAPAADEQSAPDTDEDGEELFDEVFGEQPEPEEAAAEPVAELVAQAPAPEPEPVVVDIEQEVAPPAPSAGPEKVRLGHVDGVLHRIPLEVVQAILGNAALDRVDLLRSGGSTDDLQKRMRDTDGRCAPMIFTGDDPNTAPVLFSGIETLAAAMELGHSEVSVVTIASKDAGAIQSWLGRSEVKTAKREDDVLQRVQVR